MAAADARFFGDKFLVMECTLEAETSVSNLTQYKLFIGDDKKIRFLEWPSPLIQKGRTINSDGLNIREETFLLFTFNMSIYYLISPYVYL